MDKNEPNKSTISELLGPALEKFITEQVEKIQHNGPQLLPKEALIEQKKQKILQHTETQLTNLQNCILRGFTAIQEVLPGLTSKEEWEKAQKESYAAGKKIENNEVTIFAEDMEEEEPVGMNETLGISDETVEHFYQASRELYKNERYEDAANVLKVVNFLYPFDGVYWLALGMAEHQQNRHIEALQGYATASLVDDEMPEPLFLSASIYAEIKQYEDAEQELEALDELLINIGEVDSWKTDIHKLRQKIKVNKIKKR